MNSFVISRFLVHPFSTVLTAVATRNVVFFRNQDINIEQQKSLGTRLGELSGKPETSKLHIHPLTPEFSENGDHISEINSTRLNVYYANDDRSKLHSQNWHAEYVLNTC